MSGNPSKHTWGSDEDPVKPLYEAIITQVKQAHPYKDEVFTEIVDEIVSESGVDNDHQSPYLAWILKLSENCEKLAIPAHEMLQIIEDAEQLTGVSGHLDAAKVALRAQHEQFKRDHPVAPHIEFDLETVAPLYLAVIKRVIAASPLPEDRIYQLVDNWRIHYKDNQFWGGTLLLQQKEWLQEILRQKPNPAIKEEIEFIDEELSGAPPVEVNGVMWAHVDGPNKRMLEGIALHPSNLMIGAEKMHWIFQDSAKELGVDLSIVPGLSRLLKLGVESEDRARPGPG